MLGGFQKPQRERLIRARTVGYLRLPYQRWGNIIGMLSGTSYRNPSRLSPWIQHTVLGQGKKSTRRSPLQTQTYPDGQNCRRGSHGIVWSLPQFSQVGCFFGQASGQGSPRQRATLPRTTLKRIKLPSSTTPLSHLTLGHGHNRTQLF